MLLVLPYMRMYMRPGDLHAIVHEVKLSACDD